MKNAFLFLSCVSVVVPPALAITPGSSAPVTVALVATFETGGLSVKEDGITYTTNEKFTEKLNSEGETVSATTEFKTILKSYKYGNREILTAMNMDGLLDGNITGWSIVAMKPGNAEDENTSPMFYAVKRGKPAVLVNISLSAGVTVESSAGKEIVDFQKEKRTYSESGVSRGALGFSLGGFSGQGIGTSSYRYVSGRLGKNEEEGYYSMYLDGASKLSNIVGSYGSSESEGVDVLVEGSLAIAPGKIVDLETLGFVP